MSSPVMSRENKIHHNPHSYEARRTVCGSIAHLRNKYAANAAAEFSPSNKVNLCTSTSFRKQISAGESARYKPQSQPVQQKTTKQTEVEQSVRLRKPADNNALHLQSDNKSPSLQQRSTISVRTSGGKEVNSTTAKPELLNPVNFTVISTQPGDTSIASARNYTISKNKAPPSENLPEIKQSTSLAYSSDKHSSAKESLNSSAAFTSTVVMTPNSTEYAELSVEELNKLLRETRDYDERRAIRAILRKHKEVGNQTTVKENGSAVGNNAQSESVFGDLSKYTEEEDLKALLLQTAVYEEKKKIRRAIRELRKKNEADEQKPTETNATTLETREPTINKQKPPESPSAFNVLQDLSNGSLCVALPSPLQSDVVVEETIVSPIQHETKVLQKSDGDVQIETFSKHSRTTSESDLVVKSTKVKKMSNVGELEVCEEDQIVTRKKTATTGSLSEETGFISRVDIKEPGGAVFTEEDISIEKTCHSKETGNDTITQLDISVVKAKAPPTVISSLTDCQKVDGEALLLTCEFESVDDCLTVAWTKDDKPIKPCKDIILSWQPPQANLKITELLYPDDSGIYTCTASNKQGSVSTAAKVTVTTSGEVEETPVTFKPVLLKGLEDVSVSDGQSLILSVKVKDAQDCAVTWFKGDKKLKNSSDFKQTFVNGEATLSISEIFPEDEGEMSMLIVNSQGQVESKCNLTVTDSDVVGKVKNKLTFLQGLSDTSVIDGQLNACLTCTLSEKFHNVTVTWYKDGKVLKDSKDFRQSFDGLVVKLTMSEVYPEDAGEYECLVENQTAEVSTFCKLSVTENAAVNEKCAIQTDDNNNIDAIEDEQELQKILDKTDDSGQRKIIEARLSAIKDKKRAESKVDMTDENNKTEDRKENVIDSSLLEAGEDKQKPSIKENSVDALNSASSGQNDQKSAGTESVNESGLVKSDVDGAAGNQAGEALRNKTDVDEKSKAAHANNNDQEINKKTTTAKIEKPALKSTPKIGATTKSTAVDSTADLLADKLSRSSNSAGQVTINQTWSVSNNEGGLKRSTNFASKSWGKSGAMSALLGGKTAPAGARGAMAAFKQMDTSNNPNGAPAKPNYARTTTVGPSRPGVQRSATEIKQILLNWCKTKTQDYENVKIDNFSTSWNDGVAFLALIHHFYPDSFDWEKVDSRRRRENFQLAFDLAEKHADICPLLEVDDMVRMKKPDWKCVFTYIQSFYRKLRDHENNKHTYPTTP